jgi:hypothetical protein
MPQELRGQSIHQDGDSGPGLPRHRVLSAVGINRFPFAKHLFNFAPALGTASRKLMIRKRVTIRYTLWC